MKETLTYKTNFVAYAIVNDFLGYNGSVERRNGRIYVCVEGNKHILSKHRFASCYDTLKKNDLKLFNEIKGEFENEVQGSN